MHEQQNNHYCNAFVQNNYLYGSTNWKFSPSILPNQLSMCSHLFSLHLRLERTLKKNLWILYFLLASLPPVIHVFLRPFSTFSYFSLSQIKKKHAQQNIQVRYYLAVGKEIFYFFIYFSCVTVSKLAGHWTEWHNMASMCMSVFLVGLVYRLKCNLASCPIPSTTT